MKTCQNCLLSHSDPYIKFCRPCYKGLKRNPNFKPLGKKIIQKGQPCKKCGKIRLKDHDIRGFLCNLCYMREYRIKNPIAHEKHKKICRDGKRKRAGIDVNLPLLYAPKGTGSIKKGQGYRLICKKEFRGLPHADKKGRIAEHTYIMMNHLKRPLHKGETVHHINGIKHDNRIENLELWNTSHPPGQRVEDKIKWCKEFLSKYEKSEYDKE